METTMRYCLTLVRIAIIKIMSVGKDVKKRELWYTVGGNVYWDSTMGNMYGGSQKTKNRTIISSSNPTSGYIPKGNEIIILKRQLHLHVHCSIIHNSHRNNLFLLTDKQIKKM